MGDFAPRLALLINLRLRLASFCSWCGLRVGAAFSSYCKAGQGFDEAVKL